jgi:hypothetical protein
MRSDAHKIAQRQLQQTFATGSPVLDIVGNNPFTAITNVNTETYLSDLLTAKTEVRAGRRVIDVLLQTRDGTALDSSYALEVIGTSPPDYGAIINHLRSGYAVALLYIGDNSCVTATDCSLIANIETGLSIDDYAPGWISVGDQACLGTILSLTNTRYRVKSWANELAPALNTHYTWTFKREVLPEIPIQHPVTPVGVFEVVDSDCLDCLSAGIYRGYHDHTQTDPVVYLVGTDQEYVRLQTSELQAVQNAKALARVTPLPGSTPSL